MPVNPGMGRLPEVEATGCEACDALPGLLEVVAAGCGARGMPPGNDEGEKFVGPTVGVVPGVGLAGLILERNSVCRKLSGSGGGPAGLGVPM